MTRTPDEIKKGLELCYEDIVGLKPPRWISVEERLPEDHKIVLLGYIGDNIVDCGYLDTEEAEWCNYESIQVKTPTHWMPLPEPPEEVQN